MYIVYPNLESSAVQSRPKAQAVRCAGQLNTTCLGVVDVTSTTKIIFWWRKVNIGLKSWDKTPMQKCHLKPNYKKCFPQPKKPNPQTQNRVVFQSLAFCLWHLDRIPRASTLITLV